MKLWLNHILACPDDKSFPLGLKIFNWDSEIAIFSELIKIYDKKTLINLKNPKNLFNIQFLDLTPPEINEKNREITLELDHENIINIFMEEGKIMLKDYNVVNPAPLKDYIGYYTSFMEELNEITDDSATEPAKGLLGTVKAKISPKLDEFSNAIEARVKKIDNSADEDAKISAIFGLLEPIFQELLLLNYYLFLMEIDEGILICPECKRWFPIIKTIPRLMPKNMEKTDLDIEFKNKWTDRIPPDAV